MLRIGQLVMIIFPGELTTMAGRRLRWVAQPTTIWQIDRMNRETIRTSLISQGVIGENAYVILAGPANTCTFPGLLKREQIANCSTNLDAHYVTTREEYSVQRYEGGSTLYGQCERIIPHPQSWLMAQQSLSKHSSTTTPSLCLTSYPQQGHPHLVHHNQINQAGISPSRRVYSTEAQEFLLTVILI